MGKVTPHAHGGHSKPQKRNSAVLAPSARQVVDGHIPYFTLRLGVADTPEFAPFPVFRDPPNFAELDAQHPLWALAGWAYEHGPTLPVGRRQEFFVALVLAWPSNRGAPKREFMRTFYVWRLTELGVPIQAIAEAWCVQEDTAARWIERGRNNAETWLSAREPRVELGNERDGPEPFPASIVAHALTNFLPLDDGRALDRLPHVLVTHGFLRSLARLDLAQSRTGRFRVSESSAANDRPSAQ